MAFPNVFSAGVKFMQFASSCFLCLVGARR